MLAPLTILVLSLVGWTVIPFNLHLVIADLNLASYLPWHFLPWEFMDLLWQLS